MSLLLGPPQAELAGCSLPPRRTLFHSHFDGPCVCPLTCQFPSEILDFQMAGAIFVYLAPRLVLHSHAGAVSVTTLPFFPGKQFKCTVCDYTAAQKPQLLRHMEQHASFKVGDTRGVRECTGSQREGKVVCSFPLEPAHLQAPLASARGIRELCLGLL